MENLTQIPLNKQSKFFFHVKSTKLLIPKFSLMILKLKLSMDGHKHLGLTLDTKLTFASHTDEKLKKAPKGLGIIKTLSLSLSLFVGINS